MFSKKLFSFIFLIILILFSVVYSIVSLESKLFTSIKKLCGKQKECIIHLHEVTPFKWDKAYFFKHSNNHEMQKIVGIKYNFTTDVDDQIVFVRKNKVIAYQAITGNYDFLYRDSLSLDIINNKRLIINFEINTQNFNSLKQFNKPFYISYYIITPQNDALQVYLYKTRCVIFPTNLNQIVESRHLNNF